MKKRNIFKNDNGQAIVEMVLILPFLLLLIMGMVEFGWILNGEITITAAAREGARTAIIYENDTLAAVAVQSAVNNAANSSSLKNVTTTTSFIDETKAVVNVNAEITPIIGFFISGDMDLHARAEMRLE